MGTRRLIFVLLGALAVFAGSASASAISSASTTIDWSQFSSTSPVTYTDQYSIPIAEANLNGVQAPQVRNDLRTWGSVEALNALTNTKGYGYTTAATVRAEGEALADGVASLTSAASAFVGRGGYFSIGEQTNDFNFSVPYAYEHTIALGTPADSAYAQSILFMTLLVRIPDTNVYQVVANETINFFNTGSSGSWSAGGTLTFPSGQSLAPGDYAFDISAFAAAAAATPAVVPEPSSLLLLGIGLAGALAVRRRQHPSPQSAIHLRSSSALRVPT